MAHPIEERKCRGYRRLRLETGSLANFELARSNYAKSSPSALPSEAIEKNQIASLGSWSCGLGGRGEALRRRSRLSDV